jgi:tetratricopeptide (TPR) repeat protein
MMREAIEGLVPLALRRVLHAAAFRTFDVDEDSPLVVARHAEKCGENDIAATKFMEVAAAAEARFRYVESQQFYTSVLANLTPQDTELQMQALAGRSRVNYCVGRHDDALFDLDAAMKFAESHADRTLQAEMLLEQATILDWKFRFPESAQAGSKASDLAMDLDDADLRLRCDLAIARSKFREGKTAEAIRLLFVLEEEAKKAQDYATRIIAMAVLGGALAQQDRLDEAEACLESMIQLSRRVGDRFHLAVAHGNRMIVWAARNDYERAIHDAHEAVSVATEIGAFPIIWICEHTLAHVLMYLARYEEALEIAIGARDIQHRCSDQPDAADTLLIARIKIAFSEPGAASDEISFLRKHYKHDELSPAHKIQTTMVELWEGEGTAQAWSDLLPEVEESLDLNERLEFLLAYARAAKRAGRGDDVVHATTLAQGLADGDSVWLPYFDALQ